MKKSLSLILAIAVLLASAFLLGGPTEVRSEDPPTPVPHLVEEDFVGGTLAPTPETFTYNFLLSSNNAFWFRWAEPTANGDRDFVFDPERHLGTADDYSFTKILESKTRAPLNSTYDDHLLPQYGGKCSMLALFKKRVKDISTLNSLRCQLENRVDITDYPETFTIEFDIRYSPSSTVYWGDPGYAEFVVYCEEGEPGNKVRTYLSDNPDLIIRDPELYNGGNGHFATKGENGKFNWYRLSQTKKAITVKKDPGKKYYAAIRVVGIPYKGAKLEVYVDHMSFKAGQGGFVKVTYEDADHQILQKEYAETGLAIPAPPTGGSIPENATWKVGEIETVDPQTLSVGSQDMVITLVEKEDFYYTGTDERRHEDAPGNYLQVTFDPTDKATDETNVKHYYWVKPNTDIDLTDHVAVNVPDPDGKTEADGTRYDFTGWSESLSQQFTTPTTIVAEYDAVVPEDIYIGTKAGTKPTGAPSRYVEVTVDPTEKAEDPTVKYFWVNPDKTVDLSSEVTAPTGKTEANGTRYDFTKWSTSLKQQFTAKTTIMAQYDTVVPEDIYVGTEADTKPAEAPERYIEVTVDPTEKAEDPTIKYFWVNPDKTVDLSSEVNAPTGKTEADGTKYVFTGWSKDLSQQFTTATKIKAQYKTVEPTQTTTEPEETTTESQETTTEPETTKEPDTEPWEDTEMVAAQAEGVESITLSEVYVDGKLLTKQEAADMGGIELVVDPKVETEIPGRIVNRQLIDGRRNYFYDIYLINKQTGNRLRNVAATVTLQEGYESLDDVQAFVLNDVPNSNNYELQKTPVTIRGNKATFYGPHFSYYVLSFDKGGMKVGGPPAVIYLRPPKTMAKERVMTAPTEAKVDAAKAPVFVTRVPATGDRTGATFAVAALLFTAAAALLLIKRQH